jgi:O-antigen/teichoic acid export membrane protein
VSSIGGALPAAKPAGLARFLSTRRSVVRGGSLLIAATLLWHASNFAFNAVAARLLGPRGYSELAAAVVLLYVASPVLVSVQTIASRATTALNVRGRTPEIRPALAAYLRRVAFVAVLLSGALTLASSGIARFLRLDSGVPIAIVGVGLCLSLLTHCQRGVFQGAQRFDRFAASAAVEAAAKVIGAVALLAVWRSVDSAVAAIPLAAACGLAVNTLLLRFLPTSRRSSQPIALPGAGYQSAAALVTFVVLALLLSADILAAKRYLPPSTAGIYAAVSLCGKVVYFATSAASLLLFPHFSERHEQKRDGRKILAGSLGVVAVLSGILVVLYFLVPEVVVIPLYGAGYRAAEPYLGRIAIAFALYALAYLAATYLLARRSWLGAAALSVAALIQLAALYSFHGSISEVVTVQIVVLGATAIALVTLGLSTVRTQTVQEVA